MQLYQDFDISKSKYAKISCRKEYFDQLLTMLEYSNEILNIGMIWTPLVMYFKFQCYFHCVNENSLNHVCSRLNVRALADLRLSLSLVTKAYVRAHTLGRWCMCSRSFYINSLCVYDADVTKANLLFVNGITTLHLDFAKFSDNLFIRTDTSARN